jgi:hypothetical protein
VERHEGAPGPQRCFVPAILLPASDEHLLSSLNRISYGGASAGTQSTRGRKVLPTVIAPRCRDTSTQTLDADRVELSVVERRYYAGRAPCRLPEPLLRHTRLWARRDQLILMTWV